MKQLVLAGLLLIWVGATAFSQTTEPPITAANTIQPSPVENASLNGSQGREIKIPAGTAIDIEASNVISSLDAKPGDLLTFQVLIPVKVDDTIVIDKKAIVTARLVKAKRAGHWGKAGKLVWTMQDVVAVDLSRVPLMANPDFPGGQQNVTGQSHGAEVATKTAVMGALLAPTVVLSPLALMYGFKRGEQAVIPEGKRFVVYVQKEAIVRAPIETVKN